jgi:hypothetical protein
MASCFRLVECGFALRPDDEVALGQGNKLGTAETMMILNRSGGTGSTFHHLNFQWQLNADSRH